ncbi:MAG: 3'(2'),5'-bisphosphate nucleotidase CysQ [Pseudomonadota bacterium]
MRDAAREAGQLALAFLEQGDLDVWDKSKDHPVSEADLAVNTLLARRLGAARPHYGWLSEETADDPKNRTPDRVWVVDPIDGTRAYIKGDPFWCVALAVVDRGDAVAGVIYAPAFDQLFEARRGGGAYLNGDPIRVGSCGDIEGCRMVASAEMMGHPAWKRPWPSVTIAEPKPNATLLRLAHVAAGWQDATLAMWRKFDWDLAAGAILLEEAGGVATTHLGARFQFNRPVPAQHSLVAAGKDLHPLLIERTQPVVLPDPQVATA